MMHSRAYTFFAFLIVLFGAAHFGSAQATAPGELDNGMFVDELARRGMSELMDRLSARGDMDADPVAKGRIIIASHYLEYQQNLEAIETAQLTEEKQRLFKNAQAELELAIASQAAMIEEHRDHVQRPVWQTQQADYVFVHLFPTFGFQAESFVLRGVPTEDQTELFNKYVGSTLHGLIDADNRFRVLEGDLSRDDEIRKQLVNSGTWDILFEDNWKGATQFWFARAAVAAFKLPEDDAYFKNVDRQINPLQKQDPKEEKTRLLATAVQKMDVFANDSSLQDIQRKAPLQIKGDALLFAGKYDEAINAYTQALSYGEDDGVGFNAWVGTAWARHKKGQSIQRDIDSLQQGSFLSAGTGQTIFRLLLVDVLHRALLERAMEAPGPQQQAAISLAYQPYLKFLNDLRKDKSIDEGTVVYYEDYVYGRWLRANEDKPVDNLPAVVVMAMGSASRDAGQRLVNKSDIAREEKRDDEAKELLDQAMPKLQKAIELLEPLAARESVKEEPEVHARTLYNLGMATYLLNRTDPFGVVMAARYWVDAATAHPEFPEGEKSAVLAVSTLQRFYDQAPRPEGVLTTYENAIKVLFEKYGTADFADNVRYVYAIDILKPEGKIEDAVNTLKPLPQGHPTYFESQRELLYLYYDQFLAAGDADDRQRFLEELKGAADRVETAGLRQVNSVSQDALKELIKDLEDPEKQINTNAVDKDLFSAAVGYDAAGHGRIMRATVEVERGNVQDALDLMSNFDEVFGMSDQLLSFGLAKRISILVKAEQVDEAAQAARDFLARFPEVAADEINLEIDRLERQIDVWKLRADETDIQRLKDQFNARAAKLAAGASAMAQAMLSRAVALKMPKDQLFALKVLRVKTLRLAGNSNGALTLADELMAEGPPNADVLHNLIELHFEIGKRDEKIADLAKAMEYAKMIINQDTGLQPGKDGKYPPMWWNAWARWAEILDAVHDIDKAMAAELVKDIPLRVRDLQRFTDSNLGGDPYRTRLRALAQKYQ